VEKLEIKKVIKL